MQSTLKFAIYTFIVTFFTGNLHAEEPTVGGKTKSEWITFIKDPNPRRREAAVVALGLIGAKDRNVQELFRELMLNDMVEKVRLKAVTVVQDFEKDNLRQLLPTLADLLKADKSPLVRAAAATALGKAGDVAKSVVNGVIDAFKDPDVNVRAAAAEAVGRIGEEGKAGVPGLIELLKDTDSAVRLAAVFSLGRIGPDGTTALGQLSTLLASDADANVRKEIARSIGILGIDAKSAVPALAKSLNTDQSVEVRQQAAVSLGKMTGELKSVAEGILTALKAEKEKSVRVLVIQAIANGLGNSLKDHIPALVEQLNQEPEGEVRLAIVQELGNLGPDAKDALPALNKTTTDVQITIREAAKIAIKKVKGS